MSEDTFPFQLSDIVGWIIKRKDGTVIRFNLQSAEELSRGVVKKEVKAILPWSTSGPAKKHYSEWCSHEPHPSTQPPIFESEGIGLWIADAIGARKVYTEFDVAVDGGNALTVPGEYDLPTLYGDPLFASRLGKFVYKTKSEPAVIPTRILKIRWSDRMAPPVSPSFWPALLEELRKMRDATAVVRKGIADKAGELPPSAGPLKVLTICQGGHGRSGSALAALMMCLSDYTPLDALTHIRTLHCARAIESKDQHLYLNEVAGVLGRTPNALEAEGVSSFKDRFLALSNPFAEPYKDRVRAGKGAVVQEREHSFL